MLKCFRRSGIVPTPTALCDAPTTKLLIPLIASRRATKIFKLFSANAGPGPNFFASMVRVSPIVTVTEGFEKIASRAGVVVFGHRPGSALIQTGL